MELSGVLLRQVPCLPGAGFDNQSLISSSSSGLCADAGSSFSGNLRFPGSRDAKVFQRAGRLSAYSVSGFSNDGHLQYYVSPRSGGNKKEKSSEMATMKKSKLIKELSRDLLMFSGTGFGLEVGNGIVTEDNLKMITEAGEVLLAQLQQLRAKEKEMKKKRKQEKARLKATQMKTKTRTQCESSGSSSESSDRECGEVVSMKMSRLRDRALVETKLDASKQDTSAVLTTPSLLIQENRAEGIEKIEDCSIQTCSRQGCCNQKDSGGCSKVSSNDYHQSKPVVVGEASTERIEVCMGGKCKKMGAEMLLEEFGKRVGVEGVVVGCKCMGKCREGPNIRVFNQLGTEEVDDGRPSNPLCIGVGLEDVGMVVANFFGEERKDLSLATRM